MDFIRVGEEEINQRSLSVSFPIIFYTDISESMLPYTTTKYTDEQTVSTKDKRFFWKIDHHHHHHRLFALGSVFSD